MQGHVPAYLWKQLSIFSLWWAGLCEVVCFGVPLGSLSADDLVAFFCLASSLGEAYCSGCFRQLVIPGLV